MYYVTHGKQIDDDAYYYYRHHTYWKIIRKARGPMNSLQLNVAKKKFVKKKNRTWHLFKALLWQTFNEPDLTTAGWFSEIIRGEQKQK